jgi:hypothetical protein
MIRGRIRTLEKIPGGHSFLGPSSLGSGPSVPRRPQSGLPCHMGGLRRKSFGACAAAVVALAPPPARNARHEPTAIREADRGLRPYHSGSRAGWAHDCSSRRVHATRETPWAVCFRSLGDQLRGSQSSPSSVLAGMARGARSLSMVLGGGIVFQLVYIGACGILPCLSLRAMIADRPGARTDG